MVRKAVTPVTQGNDNANPFTKGATHKELQSALDAINKYFKSDVVTPLSQKPDEYKIARVSSGSLAIDYVLGGGLPRGRIVEYYGPESSGKSTFALLACREIIRNNGSVLYIDLENALDLQHIVDLGIDTNRFMVARPDSAESAWELVRSAVGTRAFDLIVLDSIAALTSTDELESSIDKQQVAITARTNSNALKRIIGDLQSTRTALICINQVRDSIGGYGNPEVTTGGKALKFYASARIRISRVGQTINDKDGTPVGQTVNIVAKKNKTAPPNRAEQSILYYKTGVSVSKEIMEIGVKLGVLVNNMGRFYRASDYIEGDSEHNKHYLLAYGQDKFIAYLDENIEVRDELFKLCTEKMIELNNAPIIPVNSDEETVAVDDE